MRTTKNCPHPLVQYCPLYVAAHVGRGNSCDDGRLNEGGCAVDRGLDYASTLARLELDQFEMVARCQFAERQQASNDQRDRNMHAAGVH